MLARSFTQTQIWHVGSEYVWAPNSRSILQTTAGSTEVGDFVGILETWVTIALPGLTNSNTVSTTSPAPPSYARRPDLSSTRTLSLSPTSQFLLLARSTLENKWSVLYFWEIHPERKCEMRIKRVLFYVESSEEISLNRFLSNFDRRPIKLNNIWLFVFRFFGFIGANGWPVLKSFVIRQDPSKKPDLPLVSPQLSGCILFAPPRRTCNNDFLCNSTAR